MTAAYNNAQILIDVLRDPESVSSIDGGGLDAGGWTALITIARAEQLLGTLAARVKGQQLPDAVSAILDDAEKNAGYQRKTALWEADRAKAALADYDRPIALMKGTAYHAANLLAAQGRHVGDLDIMVAEDDLPQVEKALMAAGWEWVKEDEYDDAYYRDYMHELPPLIHQERDRMIDVHHTILPKTAKPSPDPAAMLARAERLDSGLYVFEPADRIIHSAAHLFADGDLAGGLRNLWDLFCLLKELDDSKAAQASAVLSSRAEEYGLGAAVQRAIRLSQYCYGNRNVSLSFADRLYIRRLLARNGYGQQTRKLTRLAFYIRSHWLRMPPLMLARHLWTKWRKGH